jgi:hypothetical protein
MFRFFIARGSHEWYSLLPELFENYNNTKYRTIGMTHMQAESDELRLKTTVTPAARVTAKCRRCAERFNVGDKIRVTVHKGLFTKGYLANWSAEIFTSIKVNKSPPSTFILQDYTGNTIARGFYAEEICKTIHPNDYLVEKIVRVKGPRALVKWLGFDSSHNS